MSDEDYGDMFITQTPCEDNVVSLEEGGANRVIKQHQYSDISDFEEDGEIELCLRYMCFIYF